MQRAAYTRAASNPPAWPKPLGGRFLVEILGSNFWGVRVGVGKHFVWGGIESL